MAVNGVAASLGGRMVLASDLGRNAVKFWSG